MSQTDKVAAMFFTRAKQYIDAMVTELEQGDDTHRDKAERVKSRLFKSMRQVDGIINGFGDDHAD